MWKWTWIVLPCLSLVGCSSGKVEMWAVARPYSNVEIRVGCLINPVESKTNGKNP